MRLSTEAQTLLARHKDRIVEALEAQGPSTVAELPRQWPVTRGMVAFLVEELEQEGRIVPVAMLRTSRAVVWGLAPAARSGEVLLRAG